MLVSGATKTVATRSGHPHLGVLTSPSRWGRFGGVLASGMICACDNDAFWGFDATRFERMLDEVAAALDASDTATRARCKFVAVPDVVADAQATLERWAEWRGKLRERDIPAALVAQDGLRPDMVPWDEVAAIFIGGSTEWKISEEALLLTCEAKRRSTAARPIWVHVGRVNSFRRLARIHTWGTVDSFDGTKFSKWPDQEIPKFLRYLERLSQGRQRSLFEEVNYAA